MPLLDVAPRSLNEYVAAGGGSGLSVALGASPDAVIPTGLTTPDP